MSVYSYGPQGPDGQGYHSQGNRRADEPFAAPGGSGPVIDMVPARQRKRHPFLYGLVLVALCGAAAYFGTVYANSRTMPEQQNVVVYQAPSGNAPVTGGARLDAASVAGAASDSVVEITTESVQTGSYFNQYVATGAGSGVIISADGYIVTNDHVISGANSIAVRLHDGTTLDAALVATDAKTDLAVIRVQAQELIPATLGTSADLVVGQPVVAIGNPLGRLGGTVTDGIISAKDRVISIDGEHMTLLQTNAAINPGNSGGALLNMNGEVIGINSNKIGGTAVEGMGYAIPITSASPIIADLMERQTRTKVAEDEVGYIGISLQEVTSQISQMYNMPEGIYVVSVEEGSAAANAGIMKGDIITKFDGSSISSYSDLQKTLQYYAVGDSVTVTVQRPQNGEYVSIELNLTLGSRPASQK